MKKSQFKERLIFSKNSSINKKFNIKLIRITDYVEVRKKNYVPVEKRFTDYYTIEHQKEFIPCLNENDEIEFHSREKSYLHYPIEEEIQIPMEKPIKQKIINNTYYKPRIQTTPLRYNIIPTYSTYYLGTRVLGTTTFIPGRAY